MLSHLGIHVQDANQKRCHAIQTTQEKILIHPIGTSGPGERVQLDSAKKFP